MGTSEHYSVRLNGLLLGKLMSLGSPVLIDRVNKERAGKNAEVESLYPPS